MDEQSIEKLREVAALFENFNLRVPQSIKQWPDPTQKGAELVRTSVYHLLLDLADMLDDERFFTPEK
jgi:hypothetical protein